MRRIRIFYSGELTAGNVITLQSEQSRHLLQVLRKKEGDTFWIFNGDGSEYESIIERIEKKCAIIAILRRIESNLESSVKIHLGQAISRGERMDYAIQKAVELGVFSITPLITDYCQVKLSGERFEKKLIHWQAVAVSAAEQSGRCVVPIIYSPTTFQQWMKQVYSELKLICCPRQVTKTVHHQDSYNTISVAIGPEGGFSDNEITDALANQFHVFSLGPRILRTETAAVVALSVLQYEFGDLG